MASIQVPPRQTPAERATEEIDVEIDEALAVHAAVLRFEERDGIAELLRPMANGLDVELHHLLTYT